MQNINIRENGLTVEFGIREDGIVELLDFSAEGVANAQDDTDRSGSDLSGC